MVSQEEVIKGLELCNEHRHRDCTECPYNDGTLFCADALMRDALELLKKQEDVVWCKDCKYSNQCFIQSKFADADNPGEWFCARGKRR